MTFGDRLREIRKTRGLTQEQLAQMIGVAKSTLTGYERDNREPNVLTITKLAQVLGVTGDDLLGTENVKSPLMFTDKEKLLVRAYRNNPDMQSAIDKILGLEPEEGEKVKVFRAARSGDNAEPQVMEVSRERLDKLKNSSKVTDI